MTDYFHSLFTDSRSSWESVICGCSHCWLNFVICMPCSHLPCIKFVLFQKVVHSFMLCTLVLWKFWCTRAHTELLLHMRIYLECECPIVPSVLAKWRGCLVFFGVKVMNNISILYYSFSHIIERPVWTTNVKQPIILLI